MAEAEFFEKRQLAENQGDRLKIEEKLDASNASKSRTIKHP